MEMIEQNEVKLGSRQKFRIVNIQLARLVVMTHRQLNLAPAGSRGYSPRPLVSQGQNDQREPRRGGLGVPRLLSLVVPYRISRCFQAISGPQERAVRRRHRGGEYSRENQGSHEGAPG